jgi:hypothetical protein
MVGLVGVAGVPAVQRVDGGRLAVWVGDPANPSGLVIDEPAAVTLAQRLVVAVEQRPAEAGFTAPLDRLRIFPPEQGAPGRLVIEGGDQAVTFLVEWPDLVALADTARQALTAADPAGSD